MTCAYAVDIDGDSDHAAALDLDHEDTARLVSNVDDDGHRYYECARETPGDAAFCVFHQLPHEDDRDPETVYPWLAATPERRGATLDDATVSRLFRRAVVGELETGDPACDVPDERPTEERDRCRQRFIGAQFGHLDLRDAALDPRGRATLDMRACHGRVLDLGGAELDAAVWLDHATLGAFNARNAEIERSLSLDDCNCGEVDADTDGVRFHSGAGYGTADDTVWSVYGAEIGWILSIQRATVAGTATAGYAEVRYWLSLDDCTIRGDVSLPGVSTGGDLRFRGATVIGDCRLDDADVDGSITIDTTVTGSLSADEITTAERFSLSESTIVGACSVTDGEIGTDCIVQGAVATLDLSDSHVGGPLRLSELACGPQLAVEAVPDRLAPPLAHKVDDEESLLTIDDAHIEGRLVANDATVAGSATVQYTTAVKGVFFDRAWVGDELTYYYSDARVFLGRRLTSSHLTLDYSSFDLEVRLNRARIYGKCSMEHLTVGGDIPSGGFDLADAEAETDLTLGGMQLQDAFVGSLSLVRSRFEGVVTMNHLTATATVSLKYATLEEGLEGRWTVVLGRLVAAYADIAGLVDLTNATCWGGLNLERATLGHALQLRTLEAYGGLRLRSCDIARTVILSDAVIGQRVNAKAATVGGDLKFDRTVVGGHVLFDRAVFESGLSLLEADDSGRTVSPTVIDGPLRLYGARVEGDLRIELADETRTQLRGPLDLAEITVTGTTEVTVPGASPTPWLVAFRGADINAGALEHAHEPVSVPEPLDRGSTAGRDDGTDGSDSDEGSAEPTTNGTPDTAAAAEVEAERAAEPDGGTASTPASTPESTSESDARSEPEATPTTPTETNQTDADPDPPESDPDVPPGPTVESTTADQVTLPGAVFDLERATVGNLSLLPDAAKPTEHVRVLETVFDGFRFSAAREDFRTADWQVHTIRGGTAGYSDIAAGKLLLGRERKAAEILGDQATFVHRTHELMRVGLEDPTALRDALNLPPERRERAEAAIRMAEADLEALAERADIWPMPSTLRQVLADPPSVATTDAGSSADGDGDTDEAATEEEEPDAPVRALQPIGRMVRGLARSVAVGCLRARPADTDPPTKTPAGLRSLESAAYGLLVAILTDEEVRDTIRTARGRADRPSIGAVLARVDADLHPDIGMLGDAPVPDALVALAHGLADSAAASDARLAASLELVRSPWLPQWPLFGVRQGAETITAATMRTVRPGPSEQFIEDQFNQARWRIRILAALEQADPDAVQPSPTRIEATYLAMKNAASEVGDNRAAGAFFVREKEWARARHWELFIRRLRPRLAGLPAGLRTRLPAALQPPSDDAADDDTDPDASETGGSTGGTATPDEHADAAESASDGSPDAAEDPEPAIGSSAEEPTPPDSDAPDPPEPDQTALDDQPDDDPAASDAGLQSETELLESDEESETAAQQAATSVGSGDPAAKPLIPVLYAYLANKFFQVTAVYGEKPQRVIGLAVGVVAIWAAGFWGIWGPAGFDTPPGVAPYGAWYGYVIVSLASFVSLVMGGTTTIASPTLRLVSLVEGFIGAFLVGLFVFTLTRSVHR